MIPKAKSPIGHFPKVSEYVNLSVSDKVVIVSNHVAGACAGLREIFRLIDLLDFESPPLLLLRSPPSSSSFDETRRLRRKYSTSAAPAAVAIVAVAMPSGIQSAGDKFPIKI